MTEQKSSKGLHISLWTAQGILAAALIMAGFMKIISPIEELSKAGMSFVNHYKSSTVRFIGISEILGAVGLILPSLLRIRPLLTPIAAAGIAIIMLLATWFHITHNEPFVATIILFLMAAFVAWGRYKKAPIHA